MLSIQFSKKDPALYIGTITLIKGSIFKKSPTPLKFYMYSFKDNI